MYTRCIYTEFHVTLISNLFFGFPESYRRFSDLTMTNEMVMSSWIDGKLCCCFFPLTTFVIFIFSKPGLRKCFKGEQDQQHRKTGGWHLEWMCVLQCKLVKLMFHLCLTEQEIMLSHFKVYHGKVFRPLWRL